MPCTSSTTTFPFVDLRIGHGGLAPLLASVSVGPSEHFAPIPSNITHSFITYSLSDGMQDHHDRHFRPFTLETDGALRHHPLNPFVVEIWTLYPSPNFDDRRNADLTPTPNFDDRRNSYLGPCIQPRILTIVEVRTSHSTAHSNDRRNSDLTRTPNFDNH